MVPSLSPALSKIELRAAMRSARHGYVEALGAAERTALEASLAEHLRTLVARAAAVGAYHSVGSEIDPSAAILAAAQVALPSVGPHLTGFTLRRGPATSAGPHGIPQPSGDADEIACDLILVPLLAIDRAGTRLGQGGGHYDRVLAGLRSDGARLIGIGWAMQRVDFLLPVEPWDVPLDGFACPAGLEMFR
ncbi:MAG: 5-formyltetrahydrofolate cyclo-ligase [Sphingomicrobium sp.]